MLPVPRAVGVLTVFPILLGQPPRLLLGHHADALGLVQGQQRELAIRLVAVGAAHAGIGPRPLEGTFDDLRALQPLHVVEDQLAVSVRLGPSEDHRLQRDDVGFLGPDRAEIIERLLHPLVVRLHAGAEQR